jgi:hypothetical protein
MWEGVMGGPRLCVAWQPCLSSGNIAAGTCFGSIGSQEQEIRNALQNTFMYLQFHERTCMQLTVLELWQSKPGGKN